MQQYIFLDELQQAPAPSPLPFGVSMVGPVIYTFGSDAQKQQFLPRIANLGRLVVPGIFRARRRLRSGIAENEGRTRRRSLRHQRAEDMDDAGATRRLDFPAGAHRSERQEAGGHFLHSRGHEDAGHHRAPDHHDRRQRRGERGLLRRRARAGVEIASARKTKAGTTRNSCSATSASVSRESASRRSGCAASASLPRRRRITAVR